MVQVGRGFINVTAAGLKALGQNSNPVIVLVRIAPKNRISSYAKITSLPLLEVFRVTGDYDVVIIVEENSLDGILSEVSIQVKVRWGMDGGFRADGLCVFRKGRMGEEAAGSTVSGR